VYDTPRLHNETCGAQKEEKIGGVLGVIGQIQAGAKTEKVSGEKKEGGFQRGGEMNRTGKNIEGETEEAKDRERERKEVSLQGV